MLLNLSATLASEGGENPVDHVVNSVPHGEWAIGSLFGLDHVWLWSAHVGNLLLSGLILIVLGLCVPSVAWAQVEPPIDVPVVPRADYVPPAAPDGESGADDEVKGDASLVSEPDSEEGNTTINEPEAEGREEDLE